MKDTDATNPTAETKALANTPHVNAEAYNQMYAESVNDPEAFWAKHGQRVDWVKPFTKVKNTSFEPGNIDIRWFEDGTLNVSANCIDRHLKSRGDQTAIIWEPDNATTEDALHITYKDLHASVCKMASIDLPT